MMNECMKVDAKAEFLRVLFNNESDKELYDNCISSKLRNHVKNFNNMIRCGYAVNDLQYYLHVCNESIALYVISGEQCMQDVYVFQPSEYLSFKYIADELIKKYGED